jgi:lysophospholipase L1-like esterase
MNFTTFLNGKYLVTVTSIMIAVGVLLAVVIPSASASESESNFEFRAIAIGDSVMLGAKSQLLEIGVVKVDAKVSRQATSGPALVKELAAKSNVKYVVVHLGTNGAYSVDTCRDTVRAAGIDRTVFLVNLKVPRKWENLNNSLMEKCAQGFSASRVRVLDWHSISQSKKSYLYSDGVHLTPTGAKRFARMIAAAIRQTITWEQRLSPGPR